MKVTDKKRKYSVSVIIPCYNEEGNIEECIRRVPKLGSDTEIVVVDDGSKDATADIIKKLRKRYKNLKLMSYFPNRGKGNAVRAGLNAAKGDVLIILDADMAVAPEEMNKFVKPLIDGKVGFTNGTRFIYKMEKGAMGKINYIGNRLMGLLFTLAIGQKITDSLCGTKALFRKDYKKIGIHKDDPWGDFSLIFGAARLGLKIQEISIHYKKRVAGKSKMKLIEHGTKLFYIWFRQFQQYRFQ
ncbi:glycosyltransferase family 2 protein [Candidatus Daviesbacteria bacterium]|nr:glycosyltransferase family 2 protein [Candidatus Daviesbacteria bacterium]